MAHFPANEKLTALEHSWVRLAETIADAGFGENMGGPLGVRLDLLAQTPEYRPADIARRRRRRPKSPLA